MSNKKEVLFLREEYGEGRGKYTYSHGEKYEGEWKNGKCHGQGTLTSPDGSKYEGEWKNGVFHGQGTFILPTGEKYEGEWKEGMVWNIKLYDSKGKNINKFVNGEELSLSKNLLKPTPSSPVSKPHLILHRVREPPSNSK